MTPPGNPIAPPLTPPSSTPPLQRPARPDQAPTDPMDKPALPGIAADKPSSPAAQSADPTTISDVRETLVQTVNDALTPGKFTFLIQHLAKPNRDRMGDVSGEKLDTLNRALTQFRNEYNAKYHKDFDFKAEFFKDLAVNQGADEKSVIATLPSAEKKSATRTPDGGAPKPSAMSPTLQPTSASATEPAVAKGDTPGPTVLLINESRTGGKPEGALWRVKIGDEISARQVKENLARHIQKFVDQKATWSDDSAVTSLGIALEVFEALNDSTLASEQ